METSPSQPAEISNKKDILGQESVQRYQITRIGIKDTSHPTLILYVVYSFFLALAMCQLLLSGVGYVPTPNVRLDIWDHVESYAIRMFLAHRLKLIPQFSLKLIISFLVQELQHHLFSLQTVTSSPVRVGTPLPLLSCCISGLRQKGLLHMNRYLEETDDGQMTPHGYPNFNSYLNLEEPDKVTQLNSD